GRSRRPGDRTLHHRREVSRDAAAACAGNGPTPLSVQAAAFPVVEEVSRLHLLEDAELRRYKDMFVRAPAIYLITDVRGVIQDANAAASAFFGATQRRIVGTALTALIAS